MRPSHHLEKSWIFLDYFCEICFVIFTSLNTYLDFALRVRQNNINLASFLTPQIRIPPIFLLPTKDIRRLSQIVNILEKREKK